ncbi:MAG: 3-phosphoshikimate 1-carboxyvinyltransferase, partial [Gemmatimonadetes bacterium]|nr:3-phosphoshikimate 1-carboxyvinyltransferase [Gemmatimonadota bacterium]
MKLQIHGDTSVPGDKSITHRALMFAALGDGESRLSGLLPGEDCRSTAAILRALGCEVPELPADGGEIRVVSRGVDSWGRPSAALDCGNSGTTARLMMGLLASRPYTSTLTGDESLRGRPMRRVTAPLRQMGAHFLETGEAGRLPIEVTGGPLRSLDYASPTSSAQVKSAILLAGLAGGVPVSVTEPIHSRDHTERMLAALGVEVTTSRQEDGWLVALPAHTNPLPALELRVPGDPSSAAFLAALAMLAGEGELRIRGVCVNPTRAGFFQIAERMGAHVERVDERETGGEPVADLVVRPAELRGVEVGEAEIPAAVDEIPILAVLAARAAGETRITGAGELRVKETDRIAAIAG